MRRRLALLLAAALASTLVTAVPAAADGHEGGTYLALGDSVPAGFRPGAPITPDGYPSHLYKHLRDDYGFDELVNLACPGDDSNEMLDGDNGPRGGSVCYGVDAPIPLGAQSQLGAALAYLASPAGDDVELITITIGANDIFLCGESDPPSCINEKLGQWAVNLGVVPIGPDPSQWLPNPSGIIPQLRAAAGPDVPIVAMNYYNPNLALWLTTPAGFQDDFLAGQVAFSAGGNAFIGAVFSALGVPVADVATAFKVFQTNGKTPHNVQAACLYTLMCEKSRSSYVLSDWVPDDPADSDTLGPQPDIHPSAKGHRKIAGTFADLIDGAGLLS